MPRAMEIAQCRGSQTVESEDLCLALCEQNPEAIASMGRLADVRRTLHESMVPESTATHSRTTQQLPIAFKLKKAFDSAQERAGVEAPTIYHLFFALAQQGGLVSRALAAGGITVADVEKRLSQLEAGDDR